MRRAVLVSCLLVAAGCGEASPPAASSPAPPPAAAVDAAHPNVTGPHGDHTPRHGGMVLMNGDVHYEVVLGADGRHAVWFSDAVRSDLPATIAREVTLQVTRPGAAAEHLTLAVDEAGESWTARGQPLRGEGVMVKLRYLLQGEPHEIEIPFVAPSAP